MEIKWVGAYENIQEFPKSQLPSHAKRVESHDSIDSFVNSSFFYLIPIILICCIVKFLKKLFYSDVMENMNGLTQLSILGLSVGISLAAVFLHEVLHAAVYPKKAIVLFGYLAEAGGLFTTSTCAMKKKRFLIMLLLPAFVLGILPLSIYFILAVSIFPYVEILFWFSFFSLLFCIGDFSNFFLILRAVPKHGIIQNSGNNTYWYEDRIG